jgi:hypothetical protein
MAMSRVVEFILERSWQHWKANSKIYKVMFHKSRPIMNGSMLERTYSAIKCTCAHKQASGVQTLRCRRPDALVRSSAPRVRLSALVQPGSAKTPTKHYKYKFFLL